MLSGCGGGSFFCLCILYTVYCTWECEGTGLLVVHALNTATARAEAIVVGCAFAADAIKILFVVNIFGSSNK